MRGPSKQFQSRPPGPAGRRPAGRRWALRGVSAEAAVVLLAALLGGLGCERPPVAQRAVLISIDTLRADHVGSYGAERAHTPTLDGIAARGTRFAHAISPAPLTLVSHSTLLTGIDPPGHGVHHNGIFRLPDDVPTLAEQARAGGFATAAFVAAFVLERRFGLARGFDHYDDRTSRQSHEGAAGAGYAERPADEVVDAALAWLESAPDRFLLWVHLYDPHADYVPPPGFAAATPGRPYDGEIAFADFQVGRLLEAVRARWPDDGTLVVVTSDHGESLGEHGERSHSHTVYDATQHVPLLVSGPGVPSGRVVEPVVALRDVAPTLVDLLGLPPLEGAGGRSLRPLLEGEEPEEVPSAYVETLAGHFDHKWSPLLGLRTDRHKYLRAPRPELYDLQNDPGETRNLAPEAPDLVARLDSLLERRVADARPVEPNRTPDDEEQARLEALGYVVPSEAHGSGRLGPVAGLDPKDGLALVNRMHEADTLLSQGQPLRALELLESVDGEPAADSALYQNTIASVALALGQGSRAEQAARAALAAEPENPTAACQLGLVFEFQGRWDEARVLYEQTARSSPRSGLPLSRLGGLAEWEGRTSEAAELYRRALAVDSMLPDPVWRLAALEFEAGHREAAAELLAGLSPTELRSPEAVLRLAAGEERAGRTDAALARLDAAVPEHPRQADLRLHRADLLAALGRGDEARRVREEALAMLDGAIDETGDGSVAPSLLLMRAQALTELDRPVEARATLGTLLTRLEALPAGLHPEVRELAASLGMAAGGPLGAGSERGS